MRRRFMMVSVLVLLAAALVSAICGETPPPNTGRTTTPNATTALAGPTVSAEKIAEVAARVTSFDTFPLVWLGTSYDSNGDGVGDLPLSDAYYSPGEVVLNPKTGVEILPALRTFTLVYGTCQIPPGQNQCTNPLSIAVYPADAAFPSSTTRSGVRARGVEVTLLSSDSAFIETADFNVAISTAASSNQAIRIASMLEGANAKAAGITKGTNFRPKAGSAAQPTTAAASTSVAAAVTPTPAPGQPASPATLVVAVGAPSLVGGNVQVSVRTTGSASAPYAGFSAHLRWDKNVFTYSSANSTGAVLASPFCPSPTVDSDGAGVTYACTSTSGSVTTTGLLATIVLAPAAAGCSPLHLFTFGAPDGGDARSGTYTVDAATSEPQAVQYADGSASVGGQVC